MQGNINTDSVAQKLIRVNPHQSHAAAYTEATSCCTVSKKDTWLQASVVKLSVPASFNWFSSFSDAQGFDVFYFLSRSYKPFVSLSLSTLSALPLFLQHLRLLI